jgi:hypothetical protein
MLWNTSLSVSLWQMPVSSTISSTCPGICLIHDLLTNPWNPGSSLRRLVIDIKDISSILQAAPCLDRSRMRQVARTPGVNANQAVDRTLQRSTMWQMRHRDDAIGYSLTARGYDERSLLRMRIRSGKGSPPKDGCGRTFSGSGRRRIWHTPGRAPPQRATPRAPTAPNGQCHTSRPPGGRSYPARQTET